MGGDGEFSMCLVLYGAHLIAIFNNLRTQV